MTIRYGARAPEQQRNREVEATSARIWSTAVTVVWETDLDVIKAVLPPPLEPSEATARIRFATVDMGTGIPVFGAGWFGVRARHGRVEGEYPLFMPMTTEQATVGGRETYGEPKKIGAVSIAVDGNNLTARFERMGFTLAEVTGTLGAEIDIPPRDKVDFYFKCSPSPDGKGFDTEPALVTEPQANERPGRPHFAIDGDLTLKDSPSIPVADLPVRRIVSIQCARAAHDPGVGWIDRVSGRWHLFPFRAPALRRPVGAGQEVMNENTRYTIISADAHAGLPCEQYRPYLDAQYHEQFDAFLAERRRTARVAAAEPTTGTSTGGRPTTRKACGGVATPIRGTRSWTPDGVAYEVMFADADAITGMASPPFGAGLSAGAITDPETAFAGARAHNRFPRRSSARTSPRRQGVGLVPITHSVSSGPSPRSSELAEQPGIMDDWSRRCGATTVRTTTPPTTRCGPRAKPRTCRCTCTRAKRRAKRWASSSVSISPRWCVWAPSRSAPVVELGCVRAVPGLAFRQRQKAPRTGSPT